jgi:integrase
MSDCPPLPDQIPPSETLTTPMVPSVATAIAAVAQWSDLTPIRRRDLSSSLSTIARWVGRAPDDVPLDPRFLRAEVITRSAAAFGVKPGRKTNVKTDITFVMLRLGLLDEEPLTLAPAWEALLERFNKHEVINLRRFARFCGLRGIGPHEVVSHHIMAYTEFLETRTLTPRPRKIAGEVRGQWNRFVKTAEGWPQTVLAKPETPRDYTHPLGAFLPSFQADVEAFGKHLAASILDDPFGIDDEVHVFDDEAPLPNNRPLRAITVTHRKDHVRWAASALIATGVPIEQITDLRCLVDPITNTRSILRFLYERAGRQASSTGTHVADTLRILARHYVRLPEARVAKISGWGAPVKLHYHGMTQKNMRTVRDALVPWREARLLALPEGLMKAARKLHEKAPAKAAGLAMRALAIEILTKLPLRLANLTGLRFDRHFHRSDLGSTQVTYIDISAEEVKNERSLTVPVSATTAAMIDEWKMRFRPAIAEPGSPFLFPGAGSTTKPITHQGMRDAIKSATQDHLGVAITPHQFRHIAAKLFLSANPGHYEEVRQLLGHKTVATTVQSYAGIEQESAIRRHDEVLSDRLRMLRADRPKRSGRR